jgi:Ni,Fe-hydrogenase III component G
MTWWLDMSVLNVNLLNFKFSYINNLYTIQINKNFLYLFFLINKKNINTLNFYTMDITIFKNVNLYNYFIAYQSIFFDCRILLQTKFSKKIESLSHVNNGSLWIERETKEFNQIQYNNLADTRKLLSNYNYNSELQYNNFNNIINDLKL